MKKYRVYLFFVVFILFIVMNLYLIQKWDDFYSIQEWDDYNETLFNYNTERHGSLSGWTEYSDSMAIEVKLYCSLKKKIDKSAIIVSDRVECKFRLIPHEESLFLSQIQVNDVRDGFENVYMKKGYNLLEDCHDFEWDKFNECIDYIRNESEAVFGLVDVMVYSDDAILSGNYDEYDILLNDMMMTADNINPIGIDLLESGHYKLIFNFRIEEVDDDKYIIGDSSYDIMGDDIIVHNVRHVIEFDVLTSKDYETKEIERFGFLIAIILGLNLGLAEFLSKANAFRKWSEVDSFIGRWWKKIVS